MPVEDIAALALALSGRDQNCTGRDSDTSLSSLDHWHYCRRTGDDYDDVASAPVRKVAERKIHYCQCYFCAFQRESERRRHCMTRNLKMPGRSLFDSGSDRTGDARPVHTQTGIGTQAFGLQRRQVLLEVEELNERMTARFESESLRPRLLLSKTNIRVMMMFIVGPGGADGIKFKFDAQARAAREGRLRLHQTQRRTSEGCTIIMWLACWQQEAQLEGEILTQTRHWLALAGQKRNNFKLNFRVRDTQRLRWDKQKNTGSSKF